MIEALVALPLIDVLAGIAWLYISWKTWADYVEPDGLNESTEERALGASVILGQLGAVITAASVILAGTGAFVALESAVIAYPQNFHLFYAALWAVFALGLSVFTMGLLPANAPKKNFVRLQGVGIFCSMALFVCFAAGVRFLFAVGTILL